MSHAICRWALLLAWSTVAAGSSSSSSIPGATATCITADGISRCYHTYVPSSASSNAPLVIDLHGYGSDVRYEAESSGWREVADSDGVVVVWPEGSLIDGNPGWNAAPPGSDNKAGSVDDVALLRTIIANTVAAQSIDNQRVYAVGWSNGCMMAQYFTLVESNLVAGMACNSANLLYPPQSPPSGYTPVPIFTIHGTEDSGTTPFDLNNIAAWARYNSCTGSATTSSEAGQGTRHTYSNCATTSNGLSADVVLIELPGVGHITLTAARTRLAWTFLGAFRGAGFDGLEVTSGESGGGSSSTSPSAPGTGKDSDSKALDDGSIAGIVVGSVLGVCCLSGLLFFFCCCKGRNLNKPPPTFSDVR